mmetsp:Transcript_29275/g.53694  ORF Transcript_29275/g.53694 Transcript_29275/m.53694 type:complete len:119 (+) Transcript_29275:251-607(+)
MDKQTAILTDETIGNDTLYNTVAHLDTGALVELGGCKFVSIWIRRRRRSVRHYRAVPEASNKSRTASEQEYPKPQIMIKKDAGGATMGSCDIGGQQQEPHATEVKSGKKGKKKGKKRR